MIRALGRNQRNLLAKLAAASNKPVTAGSMSGIDMTDQSAMASMKALEKRGFAERLPHTGPTCTWGTLWRITPAGRARLNPEG